MRDGAALHVRVVGRGQPVLMLPGLGMSANSWLPFILPHLARFRFYLVDFRGAGGSAGVALKPGDVFQSHTEDVQDVIAHFGLRNFLLVGISLGCTTSLHLQREGGFADVKRYMHIDQSPCVGNREDWSHGLFGSRQQELFEKLREILSVIDRYPNCQRFADLPLAARIEASDTLSEVLALMAGAKVLLPLLRGVMRLPRSLLKFVPLPITRLDDMRAYLAAYSSGGHDYRSSLGRDAVPVTVITGVHSPLYTEAGQALVASAHPRSRVLRFERSGHVPLTDEPLRFARALSGFLREA